MSTARRCSKSLGNFTTIRTLLETYEPLALRLFFCRPTIAARLI
ncbi:MAG: hypothetical protein HC926_05960 [Synechococcaceae cyanobacterium SM2_3_60]|nr:hypothetical protein [Synechococcaceae cyanobacterium SM2_3_60]